MAVTCQYLPAFTWEAKAATKDDILTQAYTDNVTALCRPQQYWPTGPPFLGCQASSYYAIPMGHQFYFKKIVISSNFVDPLHLREQHLILKQFQQQRYLPCGMLAESINVNHQEQKKYWLNSNPSNCNVIYCNNFTFFKQTYTHIKFRASDILGTSNFSNQLA